MPVNKAMRRARPVSQVWHAALLLLSACLMMPVHADTEAQGASAVPAVRQGQIPHRKHGLEDRVRILTKRLDLDAKQQSELRKVLEDQRDQVSRIWNDTSVPAAYRVSTTQAISDQTADRIRALLNDEQKKKFSPPRPPREAAGSIKPSVEDWMDSARTK